METLTEPKITPLLCECGATVVMHGNLPGKTQCMEPGCHCGGFKVLQVEKPKEHLDAQRKT